MGLFRKPLNVTQTRDGKTKVTGEPEDVLEYTVACIYEDMGKLQARIEALEKKERKRNV